MCVIMNDDSMGVFQAINSWLSSTVLYDSTFNLIGNAH